MRNDNSRKLVIGNIHVLYNPSRGEIKLAQVKSFTLMSISSAFGFFSLQTDVKGSILEIWSMRCLLVGQLIRSLLVLSRSFSTWTNSKINAIYYMDEEGLYHSRHQEKLNFTTDVFVLEENTMF